MKNTDCISTPTKAASPRVIQVFKNPCVPAIQPPLKLPMLRPNEKMA